MLESPSTHPSGRAERRPLRVLAVAALAVVTVIHVLEFFDAETLALGALFVASAAGTFAGVVLLLARAPRSGWLVGGITSLLTLAAFCVTRTVGIPGVDPSEDIGNWSEPLGMMSLVLEALVVVLAVVALADVHRLTVDRAVAEARASIPGVPEKSPAQPEAEPRTTSPRTRDPHRV